MYEKAVWSILYATLGTRPDITYAMTVLGWYAAQPSILHREAIKHLLHSLHDTSEYKLTIHDPRLQHDSKSLVCYTDADLEGEAASSKSTSGIIIVALEILVLWRSMKQTLVAQSTMQAEVISTAYGKVQLDRVWDVISEI